MLMLDLFRSNFGMGCVPDKPGNASPVMTCSESPVSRVLSFSVEDDEPTIIDKPPNSLARSPGTMHPGEPSSEGCEIRQRTGLRDSMVPKRINFAQSSTNSGEQVLRTIDFALLVDPRWERRLEAVERLGACFVGRHPGEFNQDAANIIIPALRAAMRDERWEVRAQAAASLGSLGPEVVYNAVPVLWEACSDPEENVRRAALQAIVAHGQEAPPEHLQQPRLPWKARAWQEPPSMKAVREDTQEDTQEDSQSEQEDRSTTASQRSSAPSRSSSKESSASVCSNWYDVSARDAETRNWYAVTMDEFTMSIDKPPGSQHGLELDCKQHLNCLKVLAVNDGIVSDWNAKQERWKIEPRDCIMEINGIRGSGQELLGMLKNSTRLEVLVQREARTLAEVYAEFHVSIVDSEVDSERESIRKLR